MDEPNVILGEIRMFAGNFAPQGWAFCRGQEHDWSENMLLANLIGTAYGGAEGRYFLLPDMQDTNGVAPMGMGDGSGLTPRTLAQTVGTSEQRLTTENVPSHNHQLMASAAEAQETTPPIDQKRFVGGASSSVLAKGAEGTRLYSTSAPDTEMASAIFPPANKGVEGLIESEMASTYVNFIIATEGTFPSRGGDISPSDEALTGEICIMPYTFVPDGWEPCDGQYLSIDLYPALYSVIGNTFGNPRKGIFRLPDLRTRVPIATAESGSTLGAHTGSNRAAASWPSHTHSVRASSDTQGANSSNNPEGNTFGFARIKGTTDNDVYGPIDGTPRLIELNTETVSSVGSSTIDNTKNMQPYLGVQFCICTDGIFPSRPDSDGDE